MKNPVRVVQVISSPCSIYKTTLNPVRWPANLSSPNPIYHKINPSAYICVFDFCNELLKIKLNFDKKIRFPWLFILLFKPTQRYSIEIPGFQRKKLPNLTCVLIYLLKNCLPEDGFRDSCPQIFVTFAESYPWRNLLLRNIQYVESHFFGKKRSTK